MNLIVLGGGNSPEKDVSLRSAAAIAEAARKAGYEVREIDPAQGLSFLGTLPSDTIVLPILHGAGGEDGSIQAELEACGIAYLGSDSKVSALCFDKAQARQALMQAGLPVAKGDKVSLKSYLEHPLARLPHVLKVSHGGSSIGTLIVRDVRACTAEEIKSIFKLDSEAVLEELVEGVEVTVAILGDRALPVIEITPPEGGDFDFENKYNGATKELCPPVSVSAEVQQNVQDLALKAHQALGCRHLSRVDIIIRPNGDPVILELNTIPGMTHQSLYPKSAAADGLDLPALVTKFTELISAK